MLKKLGICSTTSAILSLVIIGFSACDPCRQLAEQICRCKESEEERKICIADLGSATQHLYFKNAENPGMCEAELKKAYFCNDDDPRGMYRAAEQD